MASLAHTASPNSRVRDQSEPNAPAPPRMMAGQRQDWLFEHVTQAFALLVLALLVAILIALGIAAIPALEKFGPAFFFTNVWNPVKLDFGAAAPIYGTIVTSLIALLIGVPV